MAPRPWLTIVGIGEDGAAGLSPAAREAVAAASIVFGGRRHLDRAGDLLRGDARAWPSPFEAGVREVLARRGSPVCVLASGDPFLFGVGATLARQVPAGEMRALPAPSAFSLAAARLGWALQEVECVSLHGRALDLVRPCLQPGRRVLALTSDAAGPAALAALLAATGFGASRLHVLEALGGPRERVRTARAAAFDLADVDTLNLVALEVVADAEARVLALAPGRPDALYEHDGQITKREIRAMTLAALAPRRGELLWDIGAGSGSIGIEWMLADPSLRAIAIEARADRAARIARNAASFGVPGLTIVEGEAPAALTGLPTPDAIFIGGGASDAGVIDAALGALATGGRLVANAVTLETEALLLARHAALGGELTRIAIARAAPVAGMTGWRPAMPVTQWSVVKP
ncbi:precorrin-6y C5,15-methyltransferase (decarboxylating) subunit CbiE [Ancylobacter terrae]|uniref:precorrin-6y C5,15-methyltransferase (decarboxylating) subunit CbiE n=1 Tax=Ancylobacter sp. sgz301288 TaxID=3342077 RepID=UPI00385A555F